MYDFFKKKKNDEGFLNGNWGFVKARCSCAGKYTIICDASEQNSALWGPPIVNIDLWIKPSPWWTVTDPNIIQIGVIFTIWLNVDLTFYLWVKKITSIGWWIPPNLSDKAGSFYPTVWFGEKWLSKCKFAHFDQCYY